MKTQLNRILLTAVLILLAGFYFGQDVYTQVSSKKVQVGVPFEFALVIKVNANSYTPPNFKDFEGSGPFQSSMSQNVNGVVTSQITLSWSLLARKEGKYTIGPAVVMAGSQKYETAPITIEVTKGAQSQQGSSDANSDVKVSDGEIFIKTVPTKTKLYVGEQLVITHKLFSRLSLVGMKKYDAPVFDGFWTKKLDVPNSAIQENIDGVAYLTAEIEKHLLYANSPGKKNIKVIAPTYVVRKVSNKKPRSFWEQFLGGQQYEDLEVKAQKAAHLPLKCFHYRKKENLPTLMAPLVN
jgi:hypothetical protein